MVFGCISDKVFINGQIQLAADIDLPPASMILYDVLRVYKGIPLFCESHAERFFQSFSIAKIQQPFTYEYFLEAVQTFISEEHIVEGNIRCVYLVNPTPDFIIYSIAHSYPTSDMYEFGVDVEILKAMRINPNIKQELDIREVANNVIKQTGVYEVLYEDLDLHITEGSRTNFFGIYKGEVITPPASDVLCGITRKKVIELLEANKIAYTERKIETKEIAQFESLFLTGTSPKVLPIAAVQNHYYDVQNPILRKIMRLYDALIQDYSNKYQNIS